MRKVLVLWLAALVAACGSAAGGPALAPTSTGVAGDDFPVTLTLGNGEVTLDEPPERIVSLSPSATETLFAVGAGELVVAADEFSTYPEEAPDTSLSGYTPNIEAISAYDPDLVVVSDDIDGVVGALEAIGIPVAHLPAGRTLEDVYAQIRQVGLLTGRGEAGESLAARLEDEVEEAVAAAPVPPRPLTYFHELDDVLYTVTSDTFIGNVYGLFGLRSIADAADDGTGYPQLSAEYVLESDPDLIFLADSQCCGVTVESLQARPGWAGLTAVRNGHVFEVDEEAASRWGPRIVDHVRAVAVALAEAAS